MAREGLIIRNETEQLAVDIVKSAHKWLNKKLGVNTKLVFSRECSWGNDSFHAGFYRDNDKQIRINFRNLYGNSIYTILEVLGHEFRHAVQYKENMLAKHPLVRNANIKSINSIDYGVWNGKQMSVKYIDAPWEKDANAYQRKYADMVIKALDIKDKIKIKLPYGTQTTKLKQETLSEFYKQNPTAVFFQARLKNGQSDSNGCYYLKLEQTKYKSWTPANQRSAWVDYKDLIESQYLEYEVKTEQFGGMSLDKMIF